MWTLAQELKDRGMTVRQAAMACGMDMATMTVLADGGKTLPQLALKVARGLGLKREQARQIGQALDATRWPKKQRDGMGLAVPQKIDIDKEWWRRVPE